MTELQLSDFKVGEEVDYEIRKDKVLRAVIVNITSKRLVISTGGSLRNTLPRFVKKREAK